MFDAPFSEDLFRAFGHLEPSRRKTVLAALHFCYLADTGYSPQAALGARGKSKTVRSIVRKAQVPPRAAWVIVYALDWLKTRRPPCVHCCKHWYRRIP